jgi:hypothetical protein
MYIWFCMVIIIWRNFYEWMVNVSLLNILSYCIFIPLFMTVLCFHIMFLPGLVLMIIGTLVLICDSFCIQWFCNFTNLYLNHLEFEINWIKLTRRWHSTTHCFLVSLGSVFQSFASLECAPPPAQISLGISLGKCGGLYFESQAGTSYSCFLFYMFF